MHTNQDLLPSLYSFLYKIIDYAGLFPPASLPLEDAIRNYIQYRTMPENWMLSRFIIPATKLLELSRLIDSGLTWEGLLTFSVLGQGGADRASFLSGLEADVQAVSKFRAMFGKRALLDVYETRWPAPELGNLTGASSLFVQVIPFLEQVGLAPFFEAPFGEGWESRASVLIQAISTHRSDFRAGFKLRTGGVTAEAFPTCGQVAFALCTCRDAGIPMKCTAGLHHPVRRFREEVGTKMHGFLNVFAAGILTEIHRLDAGQTAVILDEEDPAGFRFTPAEFVWRERVASVDQIEDIRRERLISFGSCSFEEPKEDLCELGFGLIKS